MVLTVYVYPLDLPDGNPMSAVSVGKFVHTKPKKKSHTGLISLTTFCNIKLYITDIIAITNTNTSIIKLLNRKFLLTNSVSNSSISCLSFKSKIS